MIKNIEGILLGSQNPKKLADFYKDIVGVKLTTEAAIGEGEDLFVFEMKGAGFYIIHHSEVKGKNKNPARLIFNLEVDDMEKMVEKLKKAGVKLVADTYHVQDYGYIATFEDPDGNYFQLVKTRE